MIFAANFATAAPIDLAAPASSFFASDIGDSRSVVIRDDAAFSVSSLGIRMDPLVTSFSLTAEIFAWSSITSTRGVLLATNTQSFTDAGLDFYDIGIAQNLTPGQYYELNIKPFGFGNFDMEFYNFDGPPGGVGGDSTPYAAGPVTVIDGCGDGVVAGCQNGVLSHFRLNGADVSEPASLILLGLGLAGLGFSRRRRA